MAEYESFNWGYPLSSPVETSGYGARWGAFHDARDYGSGVEPQYGQPVLASERGVVKYCGDGGGYGPYYIEIFHGTDENGAEIVTTYGHNQAALVATGDKVSRGQQIAEMGSMGNSTGPHVDFRLRVNGASLDPNNILINQQYSNLIPAAEGLGGSSSGGDAEKPATLDDPFGIGENYYRDAFTANPTDRGHAILVNGIDITAAVGGLSWHNSIDELSTTLSFETAKADGMRHMNLHEPQLGDIINFYTNIEIFRGIIISVDDASRHRNKYSAVDFGWYLNKSTETYQFNGTPALDVLRKLCEDFNIAIDSIPEEMDGEITQIFIDKTVSEIMKEVLEQAGGGYNIDFTPRGIRIYKLGDPYAYPEFRIAPNLDLKRSMDYRGGVSHTQSIEDLKNAVKVIETESNATTVKAVARDQDSIYRLGLLQEVVTAENGEDPEELAKAKLAELNQVKEEQSCEIIEQIESYTRSGCRIGSGDDRYLITSAEHSITNGIHKVKLDLRRW